MSRCSYILPQKRRTCRMLTKPGKKFCAEHAIFDSDNLEERMPCPNDPKHTVNKADLEEHLARKCNSRLPLDKFICENINVAQPSLCKELPPLSPDNLAHVAKIIENAFLLVENEVKERKLCTQAIEDYLIENATVFGELKKKHLIQQSAIIGYLLDSGLLLNSADSCLVELGSGKAQLAYWMSKVAPSCKFVLIDKVGSRNKYDRKALNEDGNLNFKRIRCSIEHLVLKEVDVAKGSKSVTAVCKHFCGSATDYGIRCLLNAQKQGLNVEGFVLAPCCHHRTEYTEYVGVDYLHSLRISSPGDFAALRHVSTWATCKFSHSSVVPLVHSVAYCKVTDLWSSEYKEELGRKAKVLLEYGRADYLKSRGFEVQMFRYVPIQISPENLLILAKLKKPVVK